MSCGHIKRKDLDTARYAKSFSVSINNVQKNEACFPFWSCLCDAVFQWLICVSPLQKDAATPVRMSALHTEVVVGRLRIQ